MCLRRDVENASLPVLAPQLHWTVRHSFDVCVQVGEYGRLKEQLLSQEELQVGHSSIINGLSGLTLWPAGLFCTQGGLSHGQKILLWKCVTAIKLHTAFVLFLCALQASVSAKSAQVDAAQTRISELELQLAQALEQGSAHSQRLATLQVGGTTVRHSVKLV